MKHYKLYVFDLDGTLLNTVEDIKRSVNHIMLEQTWPTYSTQEIGSKLGNGLKELFIRCVPADQLDSVNMDVLYDSFMCVHKSSNYKHTRPYAYITHLLIALKEKEKKLAVLSNKNHHGTVTLTERHFPNIFDTIVGERSDLDIPMKPHPYSLEQLIDVFNVSRQDVVFIGDTEIDYYTAKNAGVDFVAVAWGCRHESTFVALGAPHILTTPNELYERFI